MPQSPIQFMISLAFNPFASQPLIFFISDFVSLLPFQRPLICLIPPRTHPAMHISLFTNPTNSNAVANSGAVPPSGLFPTLSFLSVCKLRSLQPTSAPSPNPQVHESFPLRTDPHRHFGMSYSMLRQRRE
ncbi:uncharacterized protein LACBIDRAFT_334734 [Laccaria bicolor S238N-H82]|uniref:Predicted protein n=1 Tax=Laccaria bicolor (strain S238N-H82 / ATCC MYA-4686) TaxID=486041 RepID=B0E038_LACBS|nr:uncharacterized protein LACBIDRAFT_334734 [Laccaria bicolor S238N-H82]EDQ99864.1 predicted protein [Laccaria bicolor S238N-H82]|eukprot:XP_001889556.1 predicted protein [Laccaria bicolor S238N-H82]